jgi:predicted O-methyltransferase YrrM
MTALALSPASIRRSVVRRLPQGPVGRLDLLRPSVRATWGGPFNGQEGRQAMLRSLAGSVHVDVVLETGTYRGTSTEAFADLFGTPVHTVEKNPRFYTYSAVRLGRDPRITVTRGDSRAFLLDQARRHSGETVFVYLDAHWEDDLPLPEELQIIAAGLPRAVVMIDDFQVSGDPGYGYDDYGPGKALTEKSLPRMAGWTLCYPSVASHHETGQRRGCCVLFSPALSDVRIPELRVARVL